MKFWILGVLISTAFACQAEVMAVDVEGSNWTKVKVSPTIHLVKIVKTVRLLGSASKSPSARPYASINSVLTFKNDGSAIRYWMALPFSIQSPTKNVTALINGRKSQVYSKVMKDGTDVAWVFAGTIPYKGNLTVKLTYSMPLSRDEKGVAYMHVGSLGNNWKGNISSFDFTINSEKFTDYLHPIYYPLPDTNSGHVYKWAQRDFKPSENYNIYASFESK